MKIVTKYRRYDDDDGIQWDWKPIEIELSQISAHTVDDEGRSIVLVNGHWIELELKFKQMSFLLTGGHQQFILNLNLN